MKKSFPHIRRSLMASTALATLAIHNAVPVPMENRFAYGLERLDSVRSLYEHCEAEVYGTNRDALSLYAEARGVTREQAKRETFHLRYGDKLSAPFGRFSA